MAITLEDAIKYVCRIRFGCIKNLEEHIGSNYTDLFKNMGFISCGRSFIDNQMQDTWSATISADEYCKAMYGGIFF